MKVTILVPAYNEEAVILQSLTRVNQQHTPGLDFEIIVINDGSDDNTKGLLEENPQLYSRKIDLPENLGKGAAIRAGLKAARGDFVLIQDADLEYDPADYDDLFYPVLHYSADIVAGSRLTAPKYTRVHYYWHKLGNRTITFIFNVLNNTTFTDIYSGYIVFRRSLIDPGSLSSDGWEQQAELLSRAVQKGKVFYEVPISYHGRTYSEGKKIRAHHALSIISMIVKCRFSF